MIIGGLIGSAVGNKFSNNDGAGAAGTVAGAILGCWFCNVQNKKKSKKIVAPQETRWTSPTFRAAPRISHKAFKRILI